MTKIRSDHSGELRIMPLNHFLKKKIEQNMNSQFLEHHNKIKQQIERLGLYKKWLEQCLRK